MNENVCVFPGTFNPFTVGHRYLVERALEKFDRVIVAVAELTYREEVLLTDLRLKIATESLADMPNVNVVSFKGLLADYLAKIDCFNVVRGVRNKDDSAYELFLEKSYKESDSRINFIIIESELPQISAKAVRERLVNGESVSDMVCAAALDDIIKYFSK